MDKRSGKKIVEDLGGNSRKDQGSSHDKRDSKQSWEDKYSGGREEQYRRKYLNDDFSRMSMKKESREGQSGRDLPKEERVYMEFTDGSTESFIGKGSGERFVKMLEKWSQQQDAARKAAQDQSSSSKDTDDHASGGFEWMKGKLHKDKDKKK